MANFNICLTHFCELHGPSIIICTQVSDTRDHILQSSLQTCSSCKLVNNNILTTIDALNFISTQYPSSTQRYTSLTKLVMKSLSVETNSDLTKPMFYGDSLNGYSIHKIFKINDINARGAERKYSCMVISDTESDLLQNWSIISLNIHQLISNIQLKVDTTLKNQTSSSILDERYLRRAVIKPKSLIELTGDDQIFIKFHLWATELLRDILK